MKVSLVEFAHRCGMPSPEVDGGTTHSFKACSTRVDKVLGPASACEADTYGNSVPFSTSRSIETCASANRRGLGRIDSGFSPKQMRAVEEEILDAIFALHAVLETSYRTGAHLPSLRAADQLEGL